MRRIGYLTRGELIAFFSDHGINKVMRYAERCRKRKRNVVVRRTVDLFDGDQLRDFLSADCKPKACKRCGEMFEPDAINSCHCDACSHALRDAAGRGER